MQEDAGKTETEPVEEVPSLEELERELFGTPSTPEPKDIRKIDKFYEQYRQNEEFQRILDEEYSKLKEKLKSGNS
jgi:hypothetical protein